MKIKSGDIVTLSALGKIGLNNETMSINERINLTRILKNGGSVKKVFDTHAQVCPIGDDGILVDDAWLCPTFKLVSKSL